MKNKLVNIRILLFLLVISLNYTQAQNSLIVKQNNNSESGYLLTDVDRITFSGGSMLLKNKAAVTSSIVLSDINLMHFGVYSANVEIPANETSLQIYPSVATTYIMLKNAPQGEIKIAVYSLAGRLLKSIELSSASQQIDISELTNGLYLLRVNAATFKFMKL